MVNRLTLEIMYGLPGSGKTELARGIESAYRGVPDEIFGLQRDDISPLLCISNTWKERKFLYEGVYLIDEEVSTNKGLLELLTTFLSKLPRHSVWDINLYIHYFEEDRDACAFNKSCTVEQLGVYEKPDIDSIRMILEPLAQHGLINGHNVRLLDYKVTKRPDWLYKAQELFTLYNQTLSHKESVLIRVDLRDPYICSSEWTFSYNQWGHHCEPAERFDTLVDFLTIVAPGLSITDYGYINEMVEIIHKEEYRSYEDYPTITSYWRISVEQLVTYLYENDRRLSR